MRQRVIFREIHLISLLIIDVNGRGVTSFLATGPILLEAHIYITLKFYEDDMTPLLLLAS
jgi:hypothetical protein